MRVGATATNPHSERGVAFRHERQNANSRHPRRCTRIDDFDARGGVQKSKDIALAQK
jgi:hypothetical protein